MVNIKQIIDVEKLIGNKQKGIGPFEPYNQYGTDVIGGFTLKVHFLDESSPLFMNTEIVKIKNANLNNTVLKKEFNELFDVKLIDPSIYVNKNEVSISCSDIQLVNQSNDK